MITLLASWVRLVRLIDAAVVEDFPFAPWLVDDREG